MGRFTNKIVVITGATRGIGLPAKLRQAGGSRHSGGIPCLRRRLLHHRRRVRRRRRPHLALTGVIRAERQCSAGVAPPAGRDFPTISLPGT
jgi:NAD(P)-dependent dehydrogenase (short-subunit alcohol dehydrogenase family)